MRIELHFDQTGTLHLHHNAGESVEVVLLGPGSTSYTQVVGSGVNAYIGKVLPIVMLAGKPRSALVEDRP